MIQSIFKRIITYLILVASVGLVMGLSFFQGHRLHVERGLETYLLPLTLGLLVGLLSAYFFHFYLRKKEKEKQFFQDLAEVLAVALDERDQYTHGHARRVTMMAMEIGSAMSLDHAEMETLRLSSILHDIGKIGIPDSILLKPSALTNEEYDQVKMHPQKGGRILAQIHDSRIDRIVDIIVAHHERYDGCGYPFGLTGENIPLLARILAVADSYDAMTSDRSYRKGMDIDHALAEVKKGSGTQFDPQVVETFLLLYEREMSGDICESFADCRIFRFIQDETVSRAYEMQFCRGNYRSCARFQITEKNQRPTDLMPDGSFYRSGM
ncbi:MAG: HD-GYP domain-containing protein [Desulfobulbaceae bacterium]|uniref:HD-GYP domain-containing protein n=1 Tax=Candidatus Desulfatifera sulfidica TaxID=2841691 RepID=A0A8J6N786_9BACT|nr:HD-GYP domain-containing protein [Candidatus Desulfatifera sulfidica]